LSHRPNLYGYLKSRNRLSSRATFAARSVSFHFESVLVAKKLEYMDSTVNVGIEGFVSMMECCGANMLLLDAEGEVISVTGQFAEMFAQNTGIQLRPGSKPLEAMESKDHFMPCEWVGPFTAGLSGQKTCSIISFKKGGLSYYWEINFRQVINEEDEPYTVALARDITRQKRAESKLVEQNKELKKINTELDRFVYSASHDLRAPLMSIKGIVNIIKAEEYHKENLASYVNYIENSIAKMDNFISEIVDYSHNSRLEINPRPIDFHALVAAAVDKLKHIKELDQLEIKMNMEAAHPFSSDYDRLLVTLINIISNSVMYRDPFKDAYLQISAYTEPGKAILKFADNGVGIADHHLDKVFQMFFRANIGSKGSGLGLYIVKEVIEKLKGTISLQSKLGIGTILTIELPDLNE
jgi:signal transduction histidine kinase